MRERRPPHGTVDFGGVRREVCLAYVADQVELGDYVVVHVGFAISRVDEEEARKTYEVLQAMSQLDELEWIAERRVALTWSALGRPAPADASHEVPERVPRPAAGAGARRGRSGRPPRGAGR